MEESCFYKLMKISNLINRVFRLHISSIVNETARDSMDGCIRDALNARYKSPPD